MKVPLVSIIIPTYNRSAYIARAVKGAQDQSFSDHEIIVVDDDSKDNTARIVAELSSADPRIRWIKHSVNRGSQAARNAGIKAARGEWIAFLDSDDEWLSSSLEVRLAEAEKHKVKIVYSDCYVEYAATRRRALFGIRPLSGMIYKEILGAPGPMFQSLLVHIDALKEIGYLDESIMSYQEWDTSIRLAKVYAFGFVKEPTFIYHRHTDETISSNPFRNARGYEQVVQKHIVDMDKLIGPKGLARHYIRIAAYFLAGNKYNRVLKYLSMAAGNYLSIRPTVSLPK
ncbi:MAG: glycosyltransferase family 2 protein [Chloroflexi bacterium]|nr:MAG: glycosyltransferase family 2 protein [Chloroflexota bacterium]